MENNNNNNNNNAVADSTTLPDLILPPEILEMVLAHLDIQSLLAASRVNREWNAVAKADNGLIARMHPLLRHRLILEFANLAAHPNLVWSNYEQLLNLYNQFTDEILRAVRGQSTFARICLDSFATFTPSSDGHDLLYTHLSDNNALTDVITVGGVSCTLRDALFLRACMSTFIYHNGGASHFVNAIKLVGSFFSLN
jgi:F-box domain